MKKSVFAILMAFVFFIFLGFYLWQGIYVPKGPNLTESSLFFVKRGESAKEIADNLEKAGLIRSRLAFVIYAAATGKSGKFQAGAYNLFLAMNAPVIAEKFIAGDVAERTVVIPEGFTQKRIEETLNLKLPGENLEGYLFPDTYYFPLDITGEEVVKIMKENFSKKTAGLEITPEIIIMASLLEKEVKTKEDKELVSGILWKRMKVGMPLQVDAQMWTYKNLGLPPVPISNPGLESINAAISPKESSYWYYLSAKDGKTIFSRTLAEHNLAKAKYLK